MMMVMSQRNIFAVVVVVVVERRKKGVHRTMLQNIFRLQLMPIVPTIVAPPI